MAVSAELDRESEDERVVFVERTTFIDTVYRLGDRHGAGEALDRPTDAWVAWQRGWVAVRTRTPWEVDGVTHVPDTVLGLRLAAFLAGDRRFTVLFTPGDRRTLQGFFWSDGKLVLSILDELAPVFEVLSPEGGWKRTTLATLPKLGVVAVWPLDQEEIEQDGTLLVNAQDPLTPPTLLRLDESLAQPTVLRQAPRAFSAPEAVVSRHEAFSTDGERIPYIQVGPAGLTGDAPVHLTGYGGFKVASLPYYRGIIGKLWLERGGTTVVANIRGGGEFGTRWHEAGRRAGKILSHDDFAAVAADLVRRGVTRPARIAAEGGSNGGLLIANMLVRYPRALRRTVLHDPADRYAPLLKAAWPGRVGWQSMATRTIRRTGRLSVASPPTRLLSPLSLIPRSCLPHRDETIASIPDTRARWRPSCSHSATTHISTNPQRVAMVTAKTIWKWRPSPRSEWRSYSTISVGIFSDMRVRERQLKKRHVRDSTCIGAALSEG